MAKRILLVVLYTLAYILVHVEFLYKKFAYMGYEMNDHHWTYYSLLYLMLILPIVLVYKKDDLLEFLFSFCYLLLYVPITVTCFFHYADIGDFMFKGMVYVISFTVIFLLPNKQPSRLKIKDEAIISESLPQKKNNFMLIFGIIVSLILVGYFRNNIAFVSFEEVYDHRATVTFDSPIIGYLMLWNTYFIGPIIIIQGLTWKKWGHVAIGLLSIIIFYGINASKIALFIPLLIIFCFYVLRSKANVFNSLTICFVVLMYGCLLLPDTMLFFKATVLMRTFGITGLLTDQYDKFFQVNPYTYFSHINFVNFITNDYPYGNLPLGKVVSKFFDSNSETNSNANFWAMDGYASFGSLGVLFISLVFGWILRIWKWLINENNINYMVLMMVPFSFILLNVSLFTAILSGGYLFMLIYYYTKRIK